MKRPDAVDLLALFLSGIFFACLLGIAFVVTREVLRERQAEKNWQEFLHGHELDRIYDGEVQ